MDLNAKISKLKEEAQELSNQRSKAQQSINQIDIRLIEISGSIKAFTEVVESEKDVEVKEDATK